VCLSACVCVCALGGGGVCVCECVCVCVVVYVCVLVSYWGNVPLALKGGGSRLRLVSFVLSFFQRVRKAAILCV
jgi:hypothetical protein